MDWKDYEEITKYIYETLGKEAGVKIECHGKDCKVKGKSGVEHQIDVLTSHSDGIHIYKTAIECKYWKDSVNKDIVMKVSEIIEDAGINKGVIVSKQGFTPDGISYAKYKQIGLVELREKDYEGNFSFLKGETYSPKILSVIIDNAGINKIRSEEVEVNTVKIRLLNGEEASFNSYMAAFKKELHCQEVNKIVEKSYPMKGAKLINSKTNSIIPINGITFRGILTVRDVNIQFYLVDKIWLIMKAIFEERYFTISKRGIIEECKNPDF